MMRRATLVLLALSLHSVASTSYVVSAFRRTVTVRLKPDTTYESRTVRLKPDTTYESRTVRLKPDTTYGSPVRVGVFGLFHPRALIVSAAGGVVSLRGDRNSCVLRGGEEARMDLESGSMRVACKTAVFGTGSLQLTGPTGQSAQFELSVPGKITRQFHGRLDMILDGDALVPIVSMDLETGVASVVAAEQIMSTPPEALKAQAVAARSFLVAARGRHHGFDFCDTTHCQFLREPPAADHPAARAARETAGLVLAFRGAPVSAFYSASCGGRTRTLADAGLEAADGYPFFSVECVRRDAAGDRKGHGIGLCQEGAASLAAEHGAAFADILQHYYPGTTLEMRLP